MTEEILLRDLNTAEEMRAVEVLQKEVWGVGDLDVVPMTQLVAARHAGGVLVGAFDGPRLVGFVYGFVGQEGGHLTLHSHMLAVLPAYRNHDLGRRLKLAQRDRALVAGIRRVTWTFDPLQCLNAHFNFAKLGVVADRYFVNFYGAETSSFLHQTGTDRLWVTWLLDSPRVQERLTGPPSPADADLAGAPALVRVGAGNQPLLDESADDDGEGGERLIEIPGDIREVEKDSPALAHRWRAATRQAFTRLLPAGYLVEGFARRSRDGGRVGVYLLRPGSLG